VCVAVPKTYPQHPFSPPLGSIQLTLVRHGQSEAADPESPFPLVDGHGDPHLTDAGHAQARAVGRWLQREQVDAIYSTSLTRTKQTAQPLANETELTVVAEPDLREVFLGDWEGGMFRRMASEGTHPAVRKFRESGDFGAIPGGESNAELTTRCVGAVRRIAEQHPGQHVVAFVHGGVIASLLAAATSAPMTAFMGADNGSINRLCLAPDGWILRGFNDTSHLA
jgi:probable phosphoglycerate mutase